MAYITVTPANFFKHEPTKDPVVTGTQFEGGFSVHQHGNHTTFTGSYICPVDNQDITRSWLGASAPLIDEESIRYPNGVVVSIRFKVENGMCNVTGTIVISDPKTPFSHTGIAYLCDFNQALRGGPSTRDMVINFPYLMGEIKMMGF